jgi:hypothetical protein
MMERERDSFLVQYKIRRIRLARMIGKRVSLFDRRNRGSFVSLVSVGCHFVRFRGRRVWMYQRPAILIFDPAYELSERYFEGYGVELGALDQPMTDYSEKARLIARDSVPFSMIACSGRHPASDIDGRQSFAENPAPGARPV